MRNFKIKNSQLFECEKISWIRVDNVGSLYTVLSSKKRNVLVDPNKYEYNLQSMSRDKSKSFWNCVEKRKHSKCVATAVVKESDNIIISLSNKLLLGKLRILLHGEIGVGEVAVGEISDWGS